MYEILQVYDELLSLFIMGLEEIIEKKELREYENILLGVDSSSREIENQAKKYLNLFKEQMGKGVNINFLRSLPKSWYISLKTTLYDMEEYYISIYFGEVNRLWEIFFMVDELRQDNIRRFII